MIRNLIERIYLLNRNVKKFIFLIIDFIISQTSFYITFFLLYEKLVFTNYDYLYYQLIVTSSFIIFYYYNSFYYQIFRFFNIFKLFQIFKICLYNLIFLLFLIYTLKKIKFDLIYGTSYSFFIIYSAFLFFFSSFARSVAVIFYISFVSKKKKIIIIGLEENSKNFINNYDQTLYEVSYIFHDDQNEYNYKKIKILNLEKIHQIVDGFYDYILISKNNLNNKIIKEVIRKEHFKETKIKVFRNIKFSNPVKNLNENYFSEIELEDLIDRDVFYNITHLQSNFKDDVILITGAGGSIGSNLCEQLIANNAKEIVCLEVSEINLFNLKLKLNKFKKNTKTITKISYVLMDLGSYQNVEKLFSNKNFTSVFHAAAYKHVTIVEENKIEAFKNNVSHFINLLNLSLKNNIEKFTLVSSDKAVQPKNFMGLTKKICEEILIYNSFENLNVKNLNYKVVRFGNVFNSSGSVIPIFKEQIKTGGPLTITSKNSTRFFMSIPEAVSLILSAQQLAKGSGIFVFNMGKAISILEIAKKLIFINSLANNQNPNQNDIEIKEIGLKEGEKEHEILTDGKIIKTSNKNIFEVVETRYTSSLIKKIINFNEKLNHENDKEKYISEIIKLLMH